VRRDRLAVDVVEPGDGDARIDRAAVRPAIGGDPVDGPDTNRRDGLTSPGPGARDGIGDGGADLPLRIRRLAERGSAVRVRPRELQSLAGDPGRREDQAGDPILEPRLDREQVRNDQGDARAVVALGHERPRPERIVHSAGAANPGSIAVHLQAERRGDLDRGRADLHRATAPSSTERFVRLAS
jgi:hypothetical protein